MLTLVLIGAADSEVVVGAVLVVVGTVLVGAVAVGEPVGAVAEPDGTVADGTVADPLGSTTVIPEPVVGAGEPESEPAGCDPVTVATTVVVRRVWAVLEHAVSARPVTARSTMTVRGWRSRMPPP
jgi:hypothetical protein